MAGPDRVLASTHHCSDSSGSITVEHRWQWPTEWLYGSMRSTNPKLAISCTIWERASKRLSPLYAPAR